MAQGTGIHRFLAPLAKAASTRAILVLAAAVAFALVGCGGSSSGDDQASTGATSTARTAASAQKSSSPKEASKQAPSAAEEEQREAAAKVRAEGKQGGGGKHGPTISTPKGEQEPEITPRQREESNVASIALSSPSLPSGSVLPATYTCDGKDTWPALAWSGIPAGPEELALFAMNVQPVNEAIFFDWALAGLDPSSDGIEAGKLPAGALQGKNSFGKAGYSICPPKGTNETVIFVLYALPKALGAKQGFDPLALREEAGATAPNSGLYAVSYER